MEYKKNNSGEQDVIPVFYRIDPSHVRKQTESYHVAFAKHKKTKHSKEKMQRWKDALCKAANISRFHTGNGRHHQKVSRRLKQKYTNEHRCLFISDENYQSIKSLIKKDSENAQIIGIWGMGGIGKTTLAIAIFHEFSSKYEGSCFLKNVTRESERDELKNICNRLFTKLLGKDYDIDTTKVISSFVMKKPRGVKVFVVLDDVKTSELLQNLVGVKHDRLGAGSIVIVTTRDKHVLTSGGVDKIYAVKKMNFENSLRHFSLNAFNKTYPENGYEKVSNKSIAYTKGIPLALKVLGSLLHSKSDPSICTLQKLQYLYMGGCKSFQSLCSNTCSPCF